MLKFIGLIVIVIGLGLIFVSTAAAAGALIVGVLLTFAGERR